MTSLADSPGEAWCHRFIYQLTYSTKDCIHCDGRLQFRKNRSYAWCKSCRKKISAKAATWLRGSKLSYRQLYQLIWCWQKRKDPGFTKDALGVSYTTTRRWYARFRSHLPADTSVQLAGLVEMDESFFGKQKYDNQRIVIGAIEPKTRRIKLKIITDRDQDTFEAFTEANVSSGAVVMTDSHASYNDLGSLGYTHYSFNHSKGEYANTNQIENLWGVIKRYLRRLYGCVPTKNLQSILDEWTARQNKPILFTNPENYLDECFFRIS